MQQRASGLQGKGLIAAAQSPAFSLCHCQLLILNEILSLSELLSLHPQGGVGECASPRLWFTRVIIFIGTGRLLLGKSWMK